MRARLEAYASRVGTSIVGVLAASAAELTGIPDKVQRRGSRTLADREAKDTLLPLRLGAETLAALESLAVKRRTTISALVRDHALACAGEASAAAGG